MQRYHFIQILFAAVLLVSLFSCRAPEVKNQVEEKEHEMPWSVEILFTPGTVQDTTAVYADRFNASGKTPLSYKETKDSKKGSVIKSGAVELAKGEWYKVDINFYNKAGVKINAQYLTDEQASMHQFFFLSTRREDTSKPYPTPIATQVIYKYMDPKPSDGEKQPIGFEGALRLIDDVAYPDFYLRTQLVHVVPPATKKNKEGNYYPFDEPAKHLLGVTDIDLQIPITVKQ